MINLIFLKSLHNLNSLVFYKLNTILLNAIDKVGILISL